MIHRSILTNHYAKKILIQHKALYNNRGDLQIAIIKTLNLKIIS